MAKLVKSSVGNGGNTSPANEGSESRVGNVSVEAGVSAKLVKGSAGHMGNGSNASATKLVEGSGETTDASGKSGSNTTTLIEKGKPGETLVKGSDSNMGNGSNASVEEKFAAIELRWMAAKVAADELNGDVCSDAFKRAEAQHEGVADEILRLAFP